MVTESDILSNYLLQSAPLPSILSLEQFKTFFPRQLHDSPQLKSLYRDIQAQRNAIIDVVRENVAEEVKRGAGLRKEMLKLRREAEREDVDGEIEMERALFGNDSGLTSTKHTIQSVIPDLDGALDALEADIQRLEDQESSLKASLQQIVGSMSDLRYGKLANGQLRDSILDGLGSLREACESKS